MHVFRTPTGAAMAYETDPRPGHEGQPVSEPNRPAIQAWLNARYPIRPTRADVDAERDRRLAAGVLVTLTGYAAPLRIQCGGTDRTNLTGLRLTADRRIAAGDTTTLPFRCRGNVTHDLTPAQMIEAFDHASAFHTAVMQASWALKYMATIPADYADDSHWPADDRTAP